MQRVLSVQGMSCGHCVKRVEKIIARHEGIADIRVTLGANEATFTALSPDVDVDAIAKAVSEAGYPATTQS